MVSTMQKHLLLIHLSIFSIIHPQDAYEHRKSQQHREKPRRTNGSMTKHGKQDPSKEQNYIKQFAHTIISSFQTAHGHALG